MATKPRHQKTAMQLWVADNRKRLGLTPADLAALTGVTEDTARGWESRGKPSQDAVDILVRRFGVQAPSDTSSAVGGDTVTAALLSQLIDEQRQTRAMLEAVLLRLGGLEPDPDAEIRRRWVEEQMAREANRSPLPTPDPPGTPAPAR